MRRRKNLFFLCFLLPAPGECIVLQTIVILKKKKNILVSASVLYPRIQSIFSLYSYRLKLAGGQTDTQTGGWGDIIICIFFFFNLFQRGEPTAFCNTATRSWITKKKTFFSEIYVYLKGWCTWHKTWLHTYIVIHSD